MGLGLTKQDFTLRAMEAEDAEMVLAWRNQDHIRKNMYTDHIIGADEHQTWTDRMIADPRCDYYIFEHQKRPIGLVGFYDILSEHRRADWAFYLGVTDAPKGAGPTMEYFAIEQLFAKHDVDKLCCEIFTFNAGVIKLHERFGFTHEGLLKAHYQKDGPQDVARMALFKEVWDETKTKQAEGLFN